MILNEQQPISNSAYQERVEKIKNGGMLLNGQYRYQFENRHQLDPWLLELQSVKERSRRVKAKLTTLWQNNDFKTLARLMQFTPVKYSQQLLNQETTITPTLIEFDSKLISAQQYSKGQPQNKKVVVYLHGGGLIGGSSARASDWLQWVSASLGNDWVIINFDYPLLDTASLDEIIALLTTEIANYMDNVHATSIWLAGDSTGAYLATTIGTKIKLSIDGYILFYPQIILGAVTRQLATIGLSSKDQTMLTVKNSDFNELLAVQTALLGLKDGEKLFAPLVNAPTILFTAEFDSFNDEIATYGHKLKQQVALQTIEFAGLTHGFMDYFGKLPQAQIAADYLIKALKNQDNS